MWSPPDPKTFNALVWEITKQIPPGCVSSYGQIASMMPVPEGVAPPTFDRLGSRWVGAAMNATPQGEGIPWQRVVNSRGEISLPKGSSAAAKQRTLLEQEGVTFDERGRVDLNRYSWEGPDEAWLNEHGLASPKSLKKSSADAKQQRLL